MTRTVAAAPKHVASAAAPKHAAAVQLHLAKRVRRAVPGGGVADVLLGVGRRPGQAGLQVDFHHLGIAQADPDPLPAGGNRHPAILTRL